MNFYDSLLHSKSRRVSYIAELCRTQCISNMGINVSCFNDEASNMAEQFHAARMVESWRETMNNKAIAMACVCRELMDIRDGISTVELMSFDECKDLLHSICCDL